MKLKIHPYYYVPPCPRCYSRKPGRYMRTPISDGASIIRDGLKRGELIRFRQRVPEENAYCTVCGHEFRANVRTLWLDSDELRTEQRERGTDELYRKYMEQMHSQTPQPKGLMGFLQRKLAAPSKNVYSEYTEPARETAPTIIDNRPKDTIEILYADTELINIMLEEKK